MTILIELSEKSIEKIADVIEKKINDRKMEDEKLYNLTQLAKLLGISYHTLKKKNLPCVRINKGSTKFYSLQKVKTFLNDN